MPIMVTPTPTTPEEAPAAGQLHDGHVLDWIPERPLERQLRTVLARVVGASARCLVTGDRGVGKSETIQRLLNTELQQLAGARACPFVIFCPLIRASTPHDTLLAIARQAGYHALLDRARKHRYAQDRLRADLLSAMHQQLQVVLVVDEAHQLEEGALKAILDLLAEADHRAAVEGQQHWLGLLLIASAPHHGRLVSRLGHGERVQAGVDLPVDRPEDLAQALQRWIPELAEDARLRKPSDLAAWLHVALGHQAPTMRVLAELVRSYRAIAAHTRGAAATARFEALCKQHIGHHQRALAQSSSTAAGRDASRTGKRGGGKPA